jgi:hypothetical protein
MLSLGVYLITFLMFTGRSSLQLIQYKGMLDTVILRSGMFVCAHDFELDKVFLLLLRVIHSSSVV